MIALIDIKDMNCKQQKLNLIKLFLKLKLSEINIDAFSKGNSVHCLFDMFPATVDIQF
jgi:hypothetical protein